MSERPMPHQQHISGVSAQDHSQIAAGIFYGNVQFGSFEDPQKALEQAIIACRNALFLTDPHTDRESVISKKGTRVAGTCEWITQNETYRAWLKSDGDSAGNTCLLWISGGPGKGKTMMSIFLTKQLEEHIAHKDNTDLVFFFCSAEDKRRNTAIAVLRGLVHQMITKRPQLVKHALPYFETPKRTQQTLLSFETLWLIFSKLIADTKLGTMFCVLDGLDECEESTLEVLLPRLVSLLTIENSPSTEGTFKLAIVSRDLLRLRGCTMRVRLDPDNDEKVASDIELFVSARVQELSNIEDFNEDFRAYVQTTLLQRAEGTFLWVGFAMYELSQKQTCSEIWEALENLPSGLPTIYSRMLLRIPARKREQSQAILRWVTVAARPLQLQELVAAVGIQGTRMTVEQAARDAVARCRPLLKIQKQEVSLVHQSARDYLLRTERDSDAVLEAFRLDLESAHLELAQRCLDYIAQSDLQRRVVHLNTKLDSQLPPLLQYAALYWPEHAKSCSTLAAKLFDPSGLFFQKESALRDHWWATYKKIELFEYGPPPLLHIACTLEIMPWVEALGEEGRGSRYHKLVNEKDKSGETALHWAARLGSEAVVRLLVDLGADVKAEDKDGQTVLHSAAWAENEAVVRLLVGLGADIKAKDKDGRTVLHSAAWAENEAVVRLLVDLGADVKAEDKDGQTVLHWAAWRGNEAVVRLLVDLGADVKAKDKNGKTALHSAAWLGSEAVMRLLVDLGADVKAEDKDGETVLHLAAWDKSEAVVRLLVDLGADIKAKDKNRKTVLHSAAWAENEAVVRLLVDLGADVKARDKNGKTVLHSAALGQNEGVVRLLVDLGADVKARDKNGKTVLHSAAERGNKAAVQLLVDRGADAKAKDSKGRNAL